MHQKSINVYFKFYLCAILNENPFYQETMGFIDNKSFDARFLYQIFELKPVYNELDFRNIGMSN